MAGNKWQPPADLDAAVATSGPGAPPASDDPTLVIQDPMSVAGIPMSYSTGAGTGSPAPGGEAMGDRDVSQPNQYPARDPISGVDLPAGTGMPGSQGAPHSQMNEPGTPQQVTDPNYTSGKPGGGSGIQQVTGTVGPTSTALAGQYPPAKPLVAGDHYPSTTGAGGGTVHVGGYKKGARG